MTDPEYQLGNVILKSNFLKKIAPEPYVVSEVPLKAYRDGTKYEPMPITDDRMTQLGFIYMKPAGAGGQDQWAGYGYWIKDGLSFIGNKSGVLTLYYDRNVEWKFEFIHEIQNLYKSLTKKALLY